LGSAVKVGKSDCEDIVRDRRQHNDLAAQFHQEAAENTQARLGIGER
jgi:hypothetical protein